MNDLPFFIKSCFYNRRTKIAVLAFILKGLFDSFDQVPVSRQIFFNGAHIAKLYIYSQ